MRAETYEVRVRGRAPQHHRGGLPDLEGLGASDVHRSVTRPRHVP